MLLQRLLSPAPGTPLWLFGLRLAARLSNYTLLAFALFSLAAIGGPNLRTVGFVLLIVIFTMVNLRAIDRSRRYRPADLASRSWRRLRGGAHLLNVALPLAYLLGLWQTGQLAEFELRQAVAVLMPPLLNWLAIEQTLQVRRRGDARGRPGPGDQGLPGPPP